MHRFFHGCLLTFVITSCIVCPSFAVSDPEPLDSSYEIQDDVSLFAATPYSISPLSSSTPNYWSSSEINSVVSGVTSIKNDVFNVRVDVDSINDNVRDVELSVGNIYTISTNTLSFLQGVLGTKSDSSSYADYSMYRNLNYLRGYVYEIGGHTRSINSILSSGLNVDFSPLTSWAPSWYNAALSNVVNVSDFQSLMGDFIPRSAFNLVIHPGTNYLNRNGLVGVVPDGRVFGISDINIESYAGLGFLLRGPSGSSVSGSLLNSSDLSSTSYSSNNILSAFKPLFCLQNDVARLAHVIADPTEQALHDATKDNVQSVTDNLTGDKGVTSQDIGDLSGISSGVGDFMTTGVSPDRLTGSISDKGNYSFFSQQTADDLHTFPAPQSADDDFIDFYAINRREYSSLLGGDSDG